MAGNPAQAREARLKRLAESIEALAKKDEHLIRRAQEIGEMRIRAVSLLHGICGEFTRSLNRLLSREAVTIDPPDFTAGTFRDNGPNLIQINVRGRILQIEYTGTDELTSTENFRIPYIMEGAVRAFNQELLEKDLIEEQLLFYTLEKQGMLWRYFDARTYRSGPFDEEYLVALMERLI
jgi:hypothetical protein